MSTPIVTLLESLLAHTLTLEKLVLEEEISAEKWIAVLDDRQAVIDQITTMVQCGVQIGQAEEKMYIAKAEEINRKILSVMEQRKLNVGNQLNHIQRSKSARMQYGDIEFNGYGAFFDKKK